MRIVAGTFRGRTLVAPKGQSTRPTADRTRQAVFNVLAHATWAPDLEGARVLDLFAGSGALGIEALSHGAAVCRFVESAADARAVIRTNLQSLGLDTVGQVDPRDATSLGARPASEAPYHLAFLDPPYAQGLGETALAALAAGDWLARDAVVVLERGRADPTPAAPGFQVLDERVWGVARVTFFRPG